MPHQDPTEVDPILELERWLWPGRAGRAGYFPVLWLATADQDGNPDLRAVLLSEIRAGRLYFHTDARARKVSQLAARPAVALGLTLPESARQVTILGLAAPADPTELAVAYRNRSRYLQVLAWLNTPTTAQLTEEQRRQQWAEFSTEHPDGTLTAPDEWTGFAVTPTRFTFWQGRSDGPSHRTEYTAQPTGWTVTALPG